MEALKRYAFPAIIWFGATAMAAAFARESYYRSPYYHVRRRCRASVQNYATDPLLITYKDKRYVVPLKYTFQSTEEGGKVIPTSDNSATDYVMLSPNAMGPFWDPTQQYLTILTRYTMQPGKYVQDKEWGELTEEEVANYRTETGRAPASEVECIEWDFIEYPSIMSGWTMLKGGMYFRPMFL